MSKGKLRIEDVMSLNFDSKNIQIVRDDYMGAFKPPSQEAPHPSGLGTMPGTGQVQQSQQPVAGRGLIVKIAATHSGLITRNNGFYLPDKMRAGVTSWTDIYQKPVQVHHDEERDPIGRVVSARYVETMGPVIDRFKNSVLKDNMGREVGLANEQFWKDFVDTKTSFMRKIDMIQMMDSVLNDPHYSGLGYIELTADITDPEAIQKIIDGRFMTVSVGAVTDKAVCSSCKMDWLEDGQCDHRPGKEYDGTRCFIVAGNLDYDEVSMVNRPADRHAGVIEINYGNVKNSVQTDPRDITRDYVSEMTLTDSKLEDGSMTIENQKPEVTEEITQPVVDTATGTSETPAAEVADKKKEDPIPAILTKLFAEKPEVTAEEAQTLYDSLDLGDKKLSPEQLAKLPKSVFVGPCRTFPVIDEVHYVACVKFSNKYGELEVALSDAAKKFDSNLKRKAKALGFKDFVTVLKDAGALSDSVSTGTPEVLEDKEQKKLSISLTIESGEASDEDKMALAQTLIEQLVGTLGQDSVAKAAIARGLAMDPSVEDSLVAEVEKYEDRAASLTDELSMLRRELASLLNDVASLEDQLIEEKQVSRKIKSEQVLLLDSLKSNPGSLKEAEVLRLSDEVLENKLTSLKEEVDIQKIADSLNTGLSNQPNTKVEPPAGETEPPAEQTRPKQTPTYATQEFIDGVYRHILINENNPMKARQYIEEMIKQGLYPAPVKS